MPASEQVVKVVADYPFYNLKLAKEIAAKHGIDYSRLNSNVSSTGPCIVINFLYYTVLY